MKPRKWLDQSIEVLLYSTLFEGPKKDHIPHARELNIQLKKWQRLLEESIDLKLEDPLLGHPLLDQTGALSKIKKYRRETGERDRKAMAQGQHFKKLLERSMKEFTKRSWTQDGSGFTNRRFQDWLKKFNRAMETNKERAKVQMRSGPVAAALMPTPKLEE